MIEGLDLNQRLTFVSDDDKGDPKTEFIFRPLKGSEKINISALYNGGAVRMTGYFLLGMIKAAVVEIKNPDLNRETPESTDALMAYLDRLPAGIIVEFGGRIQDLLELSGEEAKNS